MYLAPHAFAVPRSLGKGLASAYHQVSVTTAVDGASPHALVTMLYDGLLDSLAMARGAIRSGDTALKAREVQRAVRIVEEGLRCALNVPAGGELARNLQELYAYLTTRITLANLRNDEAMLEECTRLVEPLRDAWRSIAP